MEKEKELPWQEQQTQPADESKLHPQPEIIREDYEGSNKLKGKVALITGGDSGIGRAIAVHFARAGAGEWLNGRLIKNVCVVRAYKYNL